MSDKFPYKLVYKGIPTGWTVVMDSIAGEINPSTGKKNKNPGEAQETNVAYPHKFEFAPSSLLRFAVPDGAVVETLADWQRVHQEAVDTILEAIKEWKK